MYEIYCKLREIKIHHTTIAKGMSKEIKSFPKQFFFQNGFNFNREICFNKEAGGKSCFFSLRAEAKAVLGGANLPNGPLHRQ